jgi:hypothetical protein
MGLWRRETAVTGATARCLAGCSTSIYVYRLHLRGLAGCLRAQSIYHTHTHRIGAMSGVTAVQLAYLRGYYSYSCFALLSDDVRGRPKIYVWFADGFGSVWKKFEARNFFIVGGLQKKVHPPAIDDQHTTNVHPRDGQHTPNIHPTYIRATSVIHVRRVLWMADAARNRRNFCGRAVFGAVRPGTVQVYMYIAYICVFWRGVCGPRVYIYTRLGCIGAMSGVAGLTACTSARLLQLPWFRAAVRCCPRQAKNICLSCRGMAFSLEKV